MAVLSVSTWALNQQLGPLRWTRWDASRQRPAPHVEPRPQTLSLVELPRRLAGLGFQACELGHFHLPALEDVAPSATDELRAAFAAAGVTLWSLLVDYGDLSSADPRRRDADRAYIAGWLEVAAALGARHLRVVGGEGSPDDPAAVERAVEALGALADRGAACGVTVLTENFRRLCSTAEVCTLICERLPGRLFLTADFGNFPRPSRQAGLQAVLPYARSIHVKVDAGDTAEFFRLVDLAVASGFQGAYTVVAEGGEDQWTAVTALADLLRQHPRALAG